jgi:hypothetical protein
MRWHRRTVFALVAPGLAALAGGVAVAAATNTLPFAADHGQTTAATAGSPASTAPSSPNTTASPSAPEPASAPEPNTSNGTGPDATGPAKFGLCNAYAAGQGTTNGGKADSTAFQALATAAGGIQNIAAFCADATPGSAHQGAGGSPPVSSPSGGAANTSPAGHGNTTSDAHVPPSDPGNNGQSHRP